MTEDRSRLRIALVVWSLQLGGTQKVVTWLAGALHARGHECQVVTVVSAPDEHFLVPASAERVTLGPPAPLSATRIQWVVWLMQRRRNLRRALKAGRPDAVVSFIDLTNVLALLATAVFRRLVPVMVCERSDPTRAPLALWVRVMRLVTYRRATAICVQNAAAAQWARRFGRSVVALPNPAPAAAAASRAPEQLIVSWGRLAPEKGLDLLVEALAALPPEMDEWRLLLVGDGPERMALRDLADRAGIGGRVEIGPAEHDTADLLRRAGVAVLPSHFEGFPNSAVEALHAGVPLIATRTEGMIAIAGSSPDAVRWVEPGDSQGLKDALVECLGSQSRRDELSSRGPQAVADLHPERVLDQWENAIRRVAGHRSRLAYR